MMLKKAFNEPPEYTTAAIRPGSWLPILGGFSLKLQMLVFPEMIMALIFHRSKGISFLSYFKAILLEKSHDEMVFGHYITTMPILLSKCTTQTLYCSGSTELCILNKIQLHPTKENEVSNLFASSCFESTRLHLNKKNKQAH